MFENKRLAIIQFATLMPLGYHAFELANSRLGRKL